MKTAEMCFSKTCVKFGRCYGNQGWAEAVERQFFVLKISLFEFLESFKSVAQGVLEILRKFTRCVPPSGWDRIKRD